MGFMDTEVMREKKKTVLGYMSRDVRKPVFGVSDQVRHKPGCTITD